jgi:hypothetical protein
MKAKPMPLSLIFCMLMIFSCTEKRKSVNDIVVVDDTTFISVDELPFWKEGMEHSGNKGYIDTFSVNNNRFRIIHHDTLYDGIIEKNISGKWQEIFNYERLGTHNDDYKRVDVNGDKYKDIVFECKWDSRAFLFDPEKNSFDTSLVVLENAWQLIDTANNIYCDNENINREVQSELYTFKGKRKVILYRLEFTRQTIEKENDYFVTKRSLFKIGNSSKDKILISSEPMHELVIDYDFDYVSYWKKIYKKLLEKR